MKNEKYEIVLLNNLETNKIRCLIVLIELLIVNISNKTIVARLYAKFLISMNVLSKNKFVEISKSRFVNDEIIEIKKYIKTFVNVDGDTFFFNETY